MEWKVYDKEKNIPTKAIIYISKEWIESNMPKMAITTDNNEDNKEVKVNNDDNYEEAPNIIELEDNEKFRDDEGNIVEIETRGEREYDKIYFNVDDVAKYFELPNLRKTIMKNDSGYVITSHYKIFYVSLRTSSSKKERKLKVIKSVFLTYKGMLKTLFGSRVGKADKFVDWATKTLFTVQMGDIDEKEELASGLIGIPVKSLKQVLSTSANSVPCLYQFSLGIAKDFRKSMKLPEEIPDDYIITKYGFTDNLARRTNEHTKKYNSIKGVNIELMLFIYIDPKYLSQAETDVKNYFITNEKSIKFENFKELIAINPQHLPQITKQFKYIGKEYAGCIDDVVKQFEKQLESDKKILDAERNKLTTEKLKHEIEILKHKHANEILTKDLEIANMKIEILTSRLDKMK